MRIINFQDHFRHLQIIDHFPVIKFVPKIREWFADFEDEYKVDFGGIEQLTDEVIFILTREIKEDVKPKVVEFDFTGCCHLTDGGIELLVTTFTNIRKFNATGCLKLTEQTLFNLKEFCKGLEEVTMDATAVSVIPDKPSWRLSTEGCPIFGTTSRDTPPPSDLVTKKVVILCQARLKMDICHYLNTGEHRLIEQPITVRPDGLKLDSSLLRANVFELHCHEAYFAPFITEGAVFMVVVDLHEGFNPQLAVMKMVDFIRGEVAQAPIIIAGHVETEEDFGRLKEMNENLESMFKEQVDNMEEHLEKEHYSKSVDKDFPHQWRYVQSIICSKKRNYTISLITLPDKDFAGDMNSNAVIREVDPSDQVGEVIEKWFKSEMSDAIDSLERINKADISELKSLSRPPDVLVTVLRCVLVIVTKENNTDWRQMSRFFNDYTVIGKLLNYSVYCDKHEPEKILSILEKITDSSSKDIESVKSISKLGGALWLWVKSMRSYFVKVAPIDKLRKHYMALKKEREEATAALDHARVKLKHSLDSIGVQHYPWDSNSLDANFWDLCAEIRRDIGQHCLTLKDFVKRKVTDLGMTKPALAKALCKLSRMGLVCFYPRLNESHLFLDPCHFATVINCVLGEAFPSSEANQNRVWPLGKDVVLVTPAQFEKALSSVASKEEFPVIYSFLRGMGLLGECIPTIMTGSNTDRSKLCYSWHTVPEKPTLRNGNGATAESQRKFMTKFIPEYTSTFFNKDDVNLKYSFKFRVGMAANLFPSIAITAAELGYTVQQIWEWGIFLRRAAVELILHHNIHSTMASSSIDVEARTGTDGNHGNLITAEYIWNALSPLLTMVECLILNYPNTHHKLRYYCRGECIQNLGKENTFSPTEMALSLDRNVQCSKCRTFQMNANEWLLLLGRQYMTPVHDYLTRQDKACNSCWKWQKSINAEWRYQCGVYPSFAHEAFRSDSSAQQWESNIIEEAGAPFTLVSRMRLAPTVFDAVVLLILDPSGLSMELVDIENSKLATVSLAPFAVTINKEEAACLNFIEAFDLRRGDLLSLNFRVALADQEFGDPNAELGEEHDGKDDDEEAKDDDDDKKEEEEDDNRLRYELVFKVNMAPAARVLLQNYCFLKFRVGGGRGVAESSISGLESSLSQNNENNASEDIGEEMDEIQEIQQEIPMDLLNMTNVDEASLAELNTESSTDDLLNFMNNAPLQQQLTQQQMKIMLQQQQMQQLMRSSSIPSYSHSQEKGTSASRKAIIYCHRYPRITARHFTPGMVLLRKTGIGATWSPAIVHRIEAGLLHLKSVSGESFEPVAPSYPDLAPVGLYPDEINAVVNKERLKSFDQWYNFLKRNPIYRPAPLALFPALAYDDRYKPLPVRGVVSRLCLLRPFGSDFLNKITYDRLPRLRGSSAPHILLPTDLDHSQVYVTSRLAVQNRHQQTLHFLCKGNVVGSFRQDMHIMNKEGYDLTEIEFSSFLASNTATLLWSICRCVKTQMHLSAIDVVFPKVDKDIPREEIAYGLASYLRTYRDALVLHLAKESSSLGSNFMSTRPTDHRGRSAVSKKKSVATAKVSSLRQQNTLNDVHNLLADKHGRVCDSHQISKTLQNCKEERLGSYAECVKVICLKNIKSGDKLPNAALLSCANISHLELVSCGLEDFSWVTAIPRLSYLDLSTNLIANIPSDLDALASSLLELTLSKNPIEELGTVTRLRQLRFLNMDGTLLSALPDEIGDLKELRNLSLQKTEIRELPASFSKLKELRILKITGVHNPTLDAKAGLETGLSFHQWLKFVENYVANGYAYSKLSADEWGEFFKKFDSNHEGALKGDKLQAFAAELFKSFGRLCGVEGHPDFPTILLDLPAIHTLVMSYTAIRSIPEEISNLRLLRRLIIDNCPHLEVVSGKVAMKSLEVLALAACSALKTPPKEIVHQGMAATIAYMRRLATGSTTCRKTKLMLVGLGGAGKTSLVRAMMSPNFRVSQTEGEGITDGIDISTWKIQRAKETPVVFSVWDFAGQTLYYNTHQFFLTGRSIYFLVWNIRMGHEHAGLHFWLNSITCHAPKAPIFVVGTHCDQVSASELPVDDLQRRYPSIAGFATISSASGEGVQKLVDEMMRVTLSEPYMDEKVPEAWLSFEQAIFSARANKSLLRWQDVVTLAKYNAIYDTEVRQVVRFLHDLGSVEHFDTELLRDVVIISPQWLVDGMASLVSVHNEMIPDGRLYHRDIIKVWSSHSVDVREWLLKLTETFDLTFPIPDQHLNVVPCLLPFKMPKSLHWDTDLPEIKIVYSFDYLPAGLFNRAQARMCQFSDGLDLWQRGSLLRKNGHEALVCRENDCDVVVRVHGPKPENIILTVHEIFESLIQESFQGVTYRYNVPCFDCMRSKEGTPALFSSQLLHKAIELNSSFIQCHNQFHCLSIARLQSLIPAENDHDYFVQLEDSVNKLTAASKDLENDIFLLFAEEILSPENSDLKIDPNQLKKDLEKEGLSVWMNSVPMPSFDVMVKALEHSKIFMPLLSDGFLAHESCRGVFALAVDTMRKPVILGMTGESKAWRTSDLGMKVTDHVYVNFRPSQYETRLKEVKDRTREIMTSITQNQGDAPADVFVSYCWKNSKLAAQRGYSRPGPPEALGYGDPVAIKEFLEQQGLKCWLDVERVGTNGLFTDICSGLKNSTVFLACVSDEYASSVNCQMEFRFAHVTLGLPVILAIVGTGYLWESTEIGMMSLGYPKVNLQVTNPNAYQLVLQHTKEALQATENVESEESSHPKSRQNKEEAFQEMYELAQRKLFRQIQGFVSSEDFFPTLFVIDYYDQDDSDSDSDDAVVGHLVKRVTANLLKPDEDVDSSAEALDKDRFCFKLLCEHEGGWHSNHDGIPIQLRAEQTRDLLQLAAPFLARICLILKHSPTNLDFALNAADKMDIFSLLEKNAGDGSLMRATYDAIRNHIRCREGSGDFGGLQRCHLPSGKILWLCPEHARKPRVTPLECPELPKGPDRPDGVLLEALSRLNAQLNADVAAARETGRKWRASVQMRRTPSVLSAAPNGTPSTTPSPPDAAAKPVPMAGQRRALALKKQEANAALQNVSTMSRTCCQM